MGIEEMMPILIIGAIAVFVGVSLIIIGSVRWNDGLKKGGIFTAIGGAIVLGIFIVMGFLPPATHKLYTAEEFLALTEYEAETTFTFSDDPKQVELMNDIDFSGVEYETVSLGNMHFNGNGYSLKNITLNVYQDKKDSWDRIVGVGIFSGGPTIKDLKIENLTINYYGQEANVGGLLGDSWSKTRVENVHISGTINAQNANNVGGFIGEEQGDSQIENCTAELIIKGNTNVGGFIGGSSDYYRATSYTTLKNCKNLGTVSGKDNVGGIIGMQEECEIFSCENQGKVTSQKTAGGIVGYMCKNKRIHTCTNSGEVTGGTNTGGIVGITENDAEIQGCTNEESGKVTTTSCDTDSNTCLGGIVGTANKNTSINSCTNKGIVSSDFNKVGGIVGYCMGSVKNCKNQGVVKGANDVGGIIGQMKNNLTVSTCTVTGSVTGNMRVGGLIGRFGSDDLRVPLKSSDISIMNCMVSAEISCSSYGGGIIGLVVNKKVSGAYLESNTFEGVLTVGGVSKTDLWIVELAS